MILAPVPIIINPESGIKPHPPRYFGEGDRTPKAEPFEEPLNPG